MGTISDGVADINAIEPYIGPRPFGRRDESLFFGREREAKELLSLIIAHPVVLLYAQSGAGKTSLINAKILPLLEQHRAEVLGPARVGGDLPGDLDLEDIGNIYVFNSLLSLEPEASDPQRLAKSSLTSWLHSRRRPEIPEGLFRSTVLIFDQFEELFTAFPECWQDRHGFLEELGAELERNVQLRVVFAIREEHLASIDQFAYLFPERLRTRLRLERLREAAALDAVQKPLEGTGRSFAPGAAEKLINNILQVPIKSSGATIDISGEFVEPVQLQVVCQNLWRSLPEDASVIEAALIGVYGDVDRALASYYDECLKETAEVANLKEARLRRWFGMYLITSDGTRGTVHRDARTTGGLPNEAVEMLENLRLVRPELRGGASWYELTHDRFIGPILKSNETWWQERHKERESERETIAAFETRALAWEQSNRNRDVLLSKGELLKAAPWLEGRDTDELDLSSTLKEFAQASRARAEKRRAERLLWVVTILFCVLLSAICLAGYSHYMRRQAENASTVELGRIAKILSNKPEHESVALALGRIAKILANKPGHESVALALGIRAVGPKILEGSLPPEIAVEGLREASRVVGNRELLRPVKTLDDSPQVLFLRACTQIRDQPEFAEFALQEICRSSGDYHKAKDGWSGHFSPPSPSPAPAAGPRRLPRPLPSRRR